MSFNLVQIANSFLKMKIIGSQVTDFVLQNAATTTGSGMAFDIGSNKTVSISITGTSSSRTVSFEVSDVDGNFTSIQGTRMQDLLMDIQTTGTGEKWVFDVTGWQQFRANLTAISGGNVTVKGKAVV